MKEGWEIKTIDEICEIHNGATPLRRKKENWNNGIVNWFTINDIRNQGREINFTSQKISKIGFVSSSLKLLPKNTVLLCCTASVGEYAITNIELTTNQQFNGLIVKNAQQIFPKYLFYFTSTLKEKLLNLSGKTTIDFVSMTKLKKIQIPFPSLNDQKKIVKKLDESFEKIDKAIENTKKNIENTKELFQSKLNKVFSQNTEGFKKKFLNQVCENLDNKRIPITKNKRISGKTPYYGASGIVDYVNGYIFNEDLLLVSEDGANLLARKYPIAFSVKGKTWVNNHAHVLKFENIISQFFIEYYLNYINLESFISGMAQPKLNQKKLNSIPVPYPNIEKQQEIVEVLDKLSDYTKKLESRYNQKLLDLEELKKSILDKAFKGEL